MLFNRVHVIQYTNMITENKRVGKNAKMELMFGYHFTTYAFVYRIFWLQMENPTQTD